MRVFLFLSLVSTTIVVSGCAQRLDNVEDKLADLDKRASALEVKTGSPVGSDRELLQGQKLADVRSQVASLRNELTVLAGKVESLEYETKRLTTKTEAIDQDMAQLQRGSVKKDEPQPATAEAPQSDYDKALKAHQDGDFQKSEKFFAAFVAKNPKHPLADNALFWIGDGYMSQKMFKQAIAKFQDLIDRFPKSDKKCDAMTKQIQAFKELGMQKESATFLKLRDAECK